MIDDTETRERILNFAREKFLQRGFSKVTLDELAGELGMSKKTVYKFFPSKEELLRAAVHHNMRHIQRALDQIVSSNKPFVEKLIEVMVQIGMQINRLSRASQIDIQRFAPSLWKEIDRFRREHLLSKIETMIIQAREENIFRHDVNEHVLALMLIFSVQGIMNPEVLTNNPFSAQQAFRTIFRTIFEGALTDEARKDSHLFDNPSLNSLTSME